MQGSTPWPSRLYTSRTLRTYEITKHPVSGRTLASLFLPSLVPPLYRHNFGLALCFMTTMKAEQKDGSAQDKGDSCAAGTLKNMIIPHDAAYLVSHALTNLQKDNIKPTSCILLSRLRRKRIQSQGKENLLLNSRNAKHPYRCERGRNEKGWATICRVRTGAWDCLSWSWHTYTGWMVILLSLGLRRKIEMGERWIGLSPAGPEPGHGFASTDPGAHTQVGWSCC